MGKRYITETNSPTGRCRRAIDEVDMLQRCNAEVDPIKRYDMVGTVEAAKYLGVNRKTLTRWHEADILKATVNPRNGRKEYLYTHLWVFRQLWLVDQNVG